MVGVRGIPWLGTHELARPRGERGKGHHKWLGPTKQAYMTEVRCQDQLAAHQNTLSAITQLGAQFGDGWSSPHA